MKLFQWSLCLVFVYSISFAAKDDSRPHWALQIGPNVSVRQWQDAGDADSKKILKERNKLLERARKHGMDVDAIQFANMGTNPLSAPSPVPSVTCKSNDIYCLKLDTLLTHSNSALTCPAVNFPRLHTGSPSEGSSSYGLERACVLTQVEKTLFEAKQLFVKDRNLDWIAGALSLTHACIPDFQYPQYCDAGGVVNRVAFTADILNQLKTGPRPIRFTASARIFMGTNSVELSTAESQNSINLSEEMVSGEFEVFKIDTRASPSYEGKLVVKRRNEAMAISYPFAGSLYEFATMEMLNKCTARGGQLMTDEQDGPGGPHVGFLDLGSDIKVFYLASCRIKVSQ